MKSDVPPGACHRIRHLKRADSVGIDFHKTGFAPYVSSLFLVRDQIDLERLVRGRAEMPYLFQTGERHPGVFTLETSRGGGGVLGSLASLLLLGRERTDPAARDELLAHNEYNRRIF